MATQDDYVKTALRLPQPLHAKLLDAAEASSKSMNSEIIARLESSFAISEGAVLVAALARLEAALAESELKQIAERATTAKFATSLRYVCERLLQYPTTEEEAAALRDWMSGANEVIHGISQLEIDFKQRLTAAAQTMRKAKTSMGGKSAKGTGSKPDSIADFLSIDSDGNATIVEIKTQGEYSSGEAKPAVRRHKRSTPPKKTSE